MGKTIDAPANNASEVPASVPVQVPFAAPKLPTYLFTHKEPKGEPRTFEVDGERVQVFMNRADLKYIGDSPLPPKR